MRLISLSGHPDLPLDPPRLRLVGRHRSCDLRVDSERISRRHCLLAPEGETLRVLDLGSTNGTRVNGHRVTEIHLNPGDILELAHLAYRLDLDRTPAPPSSPASAPASAEPDDRDDRETDRHDRPPA